MTNRHEGDLNGKDGLLSHQCGEASQAKYSVPEAAPSAALAAGPDLGAALAEIAFLRQRLEGACIGDSIIRDQFAGATEPMYLWAHKQAAHNFTCNKEALAISRADFPWEGRAAPELARSEGE